MTFPKGTSGMWTQGTPFLSGKFTFNGIIFHKIYSIIFLICDIGDINIFFIVLCITRRSFFAWWAVCSLQVVVLGWSHDNPLFL